VQFSNGQYKTDDDELAAAIDLAIAQNKISRFCRKVDRAAAEKMARDYLDKQKRMGGVKGQLSALSAQKAMRTEIQHRDDVLAEQNIDVAKLSEESGIQLTEEVAEVRVQEVSKVVEVVDDAAALVPVPANSPFKLNG